MVAAVGRANGVGLLEYHLSLIQGIMTNLPFLIVILLAWLLYALKCEQFVAEKLRRKDYRFLATLHMNKASFVYKRMLQVQVMLLLPVLTYASIAVWIGIRHHWFLHALYMMVFILIVCLAGAGRYRLLIRHAGHIRSVAFRGIRLPLKKNFYLGFIIKYILRKQKILFLAIKIFSCLFIWRMLLSRVRDASDMKMIFLFYSFGLFGHAVLIYKIRQMEEGSMNFYRALPASLVNRMMQYAVLYLLLFIPEIIIILRMCPAYLDQTQAFLFIFFGYGILLLLNSLLFVRLFKPFEYLKMVSILFLMIFIAVLLGITMPFTICLYLISLQLFFQNYYQFEKGH
jgi:hypothetical protein